MTDSEVLTACRAELLKDNYFHSVLEATKSVAHKIRQRTGRHEDGARVVTAALSGTNPALRINAFSTEAEKGEQRGFANLLIGMFGLFRNPTAHVPRKSWPMTEQDALDLLVLASDAHRRLDQAT